MYSINYYDCTRNIKACQYGHSKKDLQQTVGPYILVRIEGIYQIFNDITVSYHSQRVKGGKKGAISFLNFHNI